MKKLSILTMILILGCGAQVKTVKDAGEKVKITKDECIAGNCVNGTGTFQYSDGHIYIGQWRNGKYHGQGTIAWPDGLQYVGQWKNGKFDGHGTMTSPNSEKYIGQFKNGKMDGQGTMTLRINDNPEFSKKIYTGQWKNEKRDGHGIVIVYDQFGNIVFKYIGAFKENKFFGKGTASYYDRNGHIIRTQRGWWDDKFLGAK